MKTCQRKIHTHRILSLLLSLVLMLTLLPAPALAAEEPAVITITNDNVGAESAAYLVDGDTLWLGGGAGMGETYSFKLGPNTDESAFTFLGVQIGGFSTVQGGKAVFKHISNTGTISGGSFDPESSGGLFVENRDTGDISGGTFNGNQVYSLTVDNFGIISGGTFYGMVANTGTISAGTITGKVYNDDTGTITGGTFSGDVSNHGTISDGTFNGLVTNRGTIEGGAFTGGILNMGGTLPETVQGEVAQGGELALVKQTFGTGSITVKQNGIDIPSGKAGETYNVAASGGTLKGLYLLTEGETIPTDSFTIESDFRAVLGGAGGYDFTMPGEAVTIAAVFDDYESTEVNFFTYIIEGTDSASLEAAQWLDYDMPSLTFAEETTLPGDVIEKFITVGETQYEFTGFILSAADAETGAISYSLAETLTIPAEPAQGTAEWDEWYTPISDGLMAAYMLHTHSFTGATCIASGTCACGAATDSVDSTNHTGGTEVRDQKDATEFEDGYTGDTYCLGCGTKLADGEVIGATHTHSYTGNYNTTHHWDECSCGDKGDEIEHTYSAATCSTPATCSCGATTDSVDSTNHTGGTEVRNASSATATQSGYTGDTYCLGCGTILVTGSAIPATGGGYDNDDDYTPPTIIRTEQNENGELAIMMLLGLVTFGGSTAHGTLSRAEAATLIYRAVQEDADQIVLDYSDKVAGNVSSAEISIPSSVMERFVERTNADLRLVTPIADGTLDYDTLAKYMGEFSMETRRTRNGVSAKVTIGGETVIDAGVELPEGVEMTDDMKLIVSTEKATLAPIEGAVVEKTSLGDLQCPEEYDTLTDEDAVLVHEIKCRLYETLMIDGREYILWGNSQDGPVLIRFPDGRGMVYSRETGIFTDYPDSSFDRTVEKPTNTTVTIDGVTYDVAYIVNDSTYILYRDGQLAGMYPSTDDAADLHGSVQFYEGYDPETLKAQQDDNDLGSVTIPADYNNAAIDLTPGKTYNVSVIGANDISVEGLTEVNGTVTQTFKIPDKLAGDMSVKYVAVHDTNPYAAQLADAEQALKSHMLGSTDDPDAEEAYNSIKELYDDWEKENGSGAEFGTVTLSLDGLTLTATHTGVRDFSPFIVYAFVEADERSPQVIGSPFADVSTEAWYYDAVKYAYLGGLMAGTSATEHLFSPDGITTRAQIVTILHRLDTRPQAGVQASNREAALSESQGAPVAAAANPFTDVADGAWHTEAIRWAASTGITSGTGDGTTFSPNDPITREQFAAFLYRYAQHKGIDVSVGEDTNILSYEDALTVSEYAIPAMQWACGAGIITGKPGGFLDPQGSATRAEAATMLMRFCEMDE